MTVHQRTNTVKGSSNDALLYITQSLNAIPWPATVSLKSNQLYPQKGKLRIKEEVSSRIFRQLRLRERLLDRRIVLLELRGSDLTYRYTETKTIHVGWRWLILFVPSATSFLDSRSIISNLNAFDILLESAHRLNKLLRGHVALKCCLTRAALLLQPHDLIEYSWSIVRSRERDVGLLEPAVSAAPPHHDGSSTVTFRAEAEVPAFVNVMTVTRCTCPNPTFKLYITQTLKSPATINGAFPTASKRRQAVRAPAMANPAKKKLYKLPQHGQQQ
jgi:hypothetical protein